MDKTPRIAYPAAMKLRRQGILVALDTTDLGQAVGLARTLRDKVSGVKLGLEFYMAHGAQGVDAIRLLGVPIFLDLKFHDIPNTVAGAMAAVCGLGPSIVNLHAAGGAAMMRAGATSAREGAARAGLPAPKVIAVTVLTSLGDDDLAATGQRGPSLDQVRRLAQLTKDSGLDGVVCSPREIAALRADQGADFLLVTPGIRPAWAEAGDQKRTMTPGEAIRAGADFLVIGRPITGASDPSHAATRLAEEIRAGLA
jgi:orotidine-5'-phosphate decarboxylase